MTTVNPEEVEQCRNLAEAWTPVLRALAHEERLLIVLWLAGAECSVRELEEVTGMRQSLVSYHLGQLREAGLVIASVKGRSNRYRLAHTGVDQLAGMIATLEPTPELEPSPVAQGASRNTAQPSVL
jgi:DNA-binding transcriptional ArsR family regulator